MKKSALALALALTLMGSLAACGTDKNTGSHNSTNGSGTNSTTGSTANGSGASAGQVRRHTSQGRTYWDDGYYAAGPDGEVYGTNGAGMDRDLTRDARDIVRDTGDALGDIGRGIGNAARDITGIGTAPGTPSWEPDSSAVRY